MYSYEIDHILKSVAQSMDNIQQRNKDIINSDENIQNAKQTGKELADSLTSVYKSYNDLQTEGHKNDSEISQQQSDNVDNLKSKIKELGSAYIDLQTQAHSSDDGILQQQSDNITNAKNKIKELAKGYVDLQTEGHKYDREISATQSDNIDKAKSKIKELGKGYIDLQTQAHKSDAEISKQQSDNIDKVKSKIKELGQSYVSVQTEAHKNDSEINKANADIFKNLGKSKVAQNFKNAGKTFVENNKTIQYVKDTAKDLLDANGGHGQLIGGFAFGTLNGIAGYYKGKGKGKRVTDNSNPLGNGGSSSSSNSSSGSKSSSGSGSKSSSKSNTKSNSSSSSSSTDSSSDKEETKETLNWIETKISRVERIIKNLGKTVSATYKSWSERNNALSSELSQVNSEISIQQQAYNRYMQEANKVGLDAGYAQKVRDGKIDIETITDDNLKQKIEDYKNWYEKALDCSDAILDLKDDLYDLAQTNFDNITKQFEEQLDVITHSVNMVEGYIDLAETRGYLASTDYYDNLIKLETQNIGTLKNEYDSLANTLTNMTNSGQIKKYSEAWYDLYGQICDVEEALQDATKALSEYESKMRELKWSYFETQQNYITNFTDEMSWLNDLLEKQGKLIDDNGNMTNRGTASMGLHAVGYNTYMSQADDYAKEIQKINKELAKDPFNTILIDKRQEYLKAQRDSIDAAYDEIDAAKSLMKDGYDAQIDALNKLIDLKTKNMDAEKSLYDYQKSVSEKVTNISSLEKQRKAYENDNSEEGMAKRQQLDKSIKDAKTDLQETEWEQQISDVQNMMDTLASDYEEFLNQRLDDINFILNTMLDSANQNSESIKTTLTDATASVGTTLSETMNTVWTSSTGLNSIVTNYGNGFNNALTTTNKALASIEAMIKSMVQEAQKKAAEDAAKQAAAAKAAQAQTPKVNSTSNNNQNKSNKTNKSNGNFFIHKVDSYPKGRLNKENSIVDFS